MKRITLTVAGSFLAFLCGLSTASSWNHHRYSSYDQPAIKIIERCPTTTDFAPPPAESTVRTEAIYREIGFGPNLRILPEEVQLSSERLRYKVNAHYPQIAGSNEVYIQNLNQRMKELARAKYEWGMNPSQVDLRYYKDKFPDVFNTVDLDYQIFMGTDSLLSIYFVGYSYGIGAGHSVQFSDVINYDLKSRKELNLSEVFKRNVDYLEFISRYSTGLLKQQLSLTEKLKPNAEMFESWNVTPYGIRFNFDACKIASCSDGEQQVEIPYSTLQPMLSETMKERLGNK